MTSQEQALAVLREVFGHEQFRDAQGQIVAEVLAGRDALVLMPTGGGKSLCYQIPAIVRPGVGVVVSPLIALMHDQVAGLRLNGLRAAYVNSSLLPQQTAQVLSDARTGQLDLLYVAPERLVTESFLDQLDRIAANTGIALFAIDEAHCVSQWGHDFRPEYLALSVLAERFPAVPRVALTATADRLTRAEIHSRLALADAREFISSFDRPNIRYTVVDKEQVRSQLLEFVTAAPQDGASGIVYCSSRKRVDQTAQWLATRGIRALAYHAGMDPQARREAQDRFQREEDLVMVATIAFGMGIDKPDVRFVAHIDLPKSVEAYYQETGRAGRDGQPAHAWMAYGMADVVLQRSWIEQSQAPPQRKRIDHLKLDAMLGYCEAGGCRRVILLDYFGESSTPCGNCDTCLSPPQLWDGTVAAQKLLSAALRTGQRFGAGHLLDILLGRRTERVIQLGHDTLPTFGVGSDLDERTWRSVARQLVAAGLLRADAESFGALQVDQSALPLLRRQAQLELRRPADRPVRTARRGRGDRTGSPAARAHPQPHDLDPADHALFERLRAQRRSIADEQSVPAYVVCHDSTLRLIAERRPSDLAALLRIPGIGAAKAQRYGARLLAVVATADDSPDPSRGAQPGARPQVTRGAHP